MAQQGIHPEYTVTNFICGCGTTHSISSTIGGDFNIDLCASCHPFYTGKKKIVDTAGRMDKFRAREAAKEAAAK